MILCFSVHDDGAAGYDHGRDPGLADHGQLRVPLRVGQQVPREVRARLPREQVRLVRQVQVLVRVASGRPRGRLQGTSFPV